MDRQTIPTVLKAAGYEADTISADTLRRAVSKVKIAVGDTSLESPGGA